MKTVCGLDVHKDSEKIYMMMLMREKNVNMMVKCMFQQP